MADYSDMFRDFSEELKEIADTAKEATEEGVIKFNSTSVYKSSIWKDPETARLMRTFTPKEWEELTPQEKKEYEDEEPKRLAIIRAQQAEQLIKEKVQKALDVFNS